MLHRILTFAVILSTFTGCGRSEPEPVYVGHVSPLSGPEKLVGQSSMRGTKLALKKFNENLKEDSETRPIGVLHVNAPGGKKNYAGEAVRLKAINQVMAILGGRTAEQVSGLDQYLTPVVSPNGVRTPGLTKYVFLTGLTPQQRGESLAQYVGEHKQPTLSPQQTSAAIGLLASPTNGPMLLPDFLSAAGKAPLRILVLVDQRQVEYSLVADAFLNKYSELRFSASSKNQRLLPMYFNDSEELDLILQRRQEDLPDLVFFAGDIDSIRDVRSILGEQTPIFFAGPEGSQEVLLASPEINSNIILTTAWVPDLDTTENKDFKEAYRSTFKDEPDVHAALAYDNARLLFAALKLTKNFFTNKEIHEKLSQLKDFPTLIGKTQFTKAGILQRPVFIVHLHQGNAVTRKKVEYPKEK